MSNFRRVKNSRVFVTPVKNLFGFFACVTNTCEFFTRMTDLFECESDEWNVSPSQSLEPKMRNLPTDQNLVW